MKEIWQTRWQQLAARERRLIAWGGTALLIALCYAYLWQPVSMERQKLRTTLPQLRADAARMLVQQQEAMQLRNSTTARPSGSALQSAISQAAQGSGMNTQDLQLSLLDPQRASVTWPSLPFNTWVAHITLLQQQGVRLESCTVDALPEPGMVKVRGVLSAGN